MKKYLILGFVIVLAVSFFAWKTNAQSTPTISLTSASGNPGDTVTVTMAIANNTAGNIAAFNLDLTYDSNVLESPAATAMASLISDGKGITSNKGCTLDMDKGCETNQDCVDNWGLDPSGTCVIKTPGTYKIVVAGINQGWIHNGNIVSVSFHIKAGASAGTTNLSLSNLAATTGGAVTVPITTSNPSSTPAIITINSTQHATYTIDNFIQLASHWLQNVTVNTNGDVSGDGKVNTRDLGIMMSYWAG